MSQPEEIDETVAMLPLGAGHGNDSEAIERSIWRPSNGHIKDSADNLKRVIIGKSTDKKRGALPQDVQPTQKKALVHQANRMGQHPSQGIGKMQSQIGTPIHRENPHTALPPPPTSGPLTKPSTPQYEPLSGISMIRALTALLEASSDMQPPTFKFEASKEAASHNFKLLQHHNFQLEDLLNEPYNSVTAYGSEFKSIALIESLLSNHHRWPAFKTRLEQGADFPLAALDEAVRQQDFAAAMQRGNHKSADKNLDFLAAALKQEVEKGWALIIKEADAPLYPRLELAPLGVAGHVGISASGEFIMKHRVTHDLSFPGAYSNESVNSRVLDDQLEPCMFGHALLRVIHRIVHSRIRNPDTIIWLRKEDFKSAYRRLHLKASSAITSAVTITFDNEKYVLIPLRLPFGGSPCPSDFCVVSDIITDAINDLMSNKDWDPNIVHSTYVSKIPTAKPSPIDIPFAIGRELSVTMPDNDDGAADCFIDDIITSAADIGDNLQRITAAPCTIIHALAHSPSSSTFIHRQNMIADDKNEAEGAPEERKICLGWILDTRQLLVILPEHKYIAWTSQTVAMIDQASTSNKELSSLLGRFENVAIIIPMFAHFLNNIRGLQIKAEQSSHNVRISKRVRDDLQLSLSFLDKAYAGINMNLITFRAPNKIYINDASEHGLGGFATHGRAWRWHIPSALQGRAHINLLEFLAQLISIWIDILEHRTKPQDCLLGMGDSTAAMGWLRRSNFRENNEADNEWLVKQQVARKVATIVLQADAVIYRQWFRGEDNVIADSLSRDCYFLTPKAHETFLLQTVPSQVPQSFKILPVPEEISSFVSSTLAQLPVQQLRCKPQKPSDLARSATGVLSSIASSWRNQSTSTDSLNSSAISLWRRTHKQFAKHPSLQDLEQIWWKAQSMPPSHMWLRPSGQTTGRTPDWTQMARHASSSRSSYVPTATKTGHETSKKPSP